MVAGSRDTRLRFEQWARNPACLANAISAVRGVPMNEVASYEGLEPTMGQSPFALAGGQGFENALFRNGAERMRRALAEAGVLENEDVPFLDLRIRMSGGPVANLDTAFERTRQLLHRYSDISNGSPPGDVPILVAGATVRIPGDPMLPEAMLVLDVLVVDQTARPVAVRVGEIKTYPDRGGYTSPGDLAAARAQAGVYVHGLEVVLKELRLEDSLTVDRSGFLVLRRSGGRWPSVRPEEDLRYQAERARRGFLILMQIARKVQGVDGVEGIEQIAQAPVCYDPACISFCDRAQGCFRRAIEAGDACVLGEEVARFCGGIDLARAGELLEGAHTAGAAEEDFVRRVSEVSSRGVSW